MGPVGPGSFVGPLADFCPAPIWALWINLDPGPILAPLAEFEPMSHLGSLPIFGNSSHFVTLARFGPRIHLGNLETFSPWFSTPTYSSEYKMDMSIYIHMYIYIYINYIYIFFYGSLWSSGRISTSKFFEFIVLVTNRIAVRALAALVPANFMCVRRAFFRRVTENTHAHNILRGVGVGWVFFYGMIYGSSMVF
jgi:hypothetical protein